MGTFTTKLRLGGQAFGVSGGLDPTIQYLTVGQIRVVETLPTERYFPDDPCYKEEYMCVETGVGSGTMDDLTMHDDRMHYCDCHQCALWSRNLLRAAVRRHVAKIDEWLRTGEPASPEESRSIYTQLRDALGEPKPAAMLTDEEAADCGLLSELMA